MNNDTRIFLDLLHRTAHDDDAESASIEKSINKSSDFTVPDGYFTEFDTKLMAKIDADESSCADKKPNRMSYTMRLTLAVASIAASLILFVSLGSYFYHARQEIDATMETIVAYNAPEDVLIELVDGQNLEDILAEAAYEIY